MAFVDAMAKVCIVIGKTNCSTPNIQNDHGWSSINIVAFVEAMALVVVNVVGKTHLLHPKHSK